MATKGNGFPTSIVIFGASGDLTQRKLIPSLFSLYCKNRMPEQWRIVGYGGTDFNDESFRSHLQEGMKQFSGEEYTEQEWKDFASHVNYVRHGYTLEDFIQLNQFLDDWKGEGDNRLFYMATPPGAFSNIVDLLGKSKQLKEEQGWRRVVIEKPFGTDLESAKELNHKIHKVLNEKQIYRIDHYLGKETVQNILVARFANTIFEPLWNRNYIDHVEITVAEQIGVEHRGKFYDKIGIWRDIFQNHLLQLLTLVAMEPPVAFEASALRNEKVKVLSAITPMTGEEVKKATVRAQYEGYRQEEGVDPNSTTATFGAARLYINNWRWQGVPFYLRSGKYLKEKLSQITIEFKCPPHLLFPSQQGEMTPNMLVLYLQPDEGIHWRFEAKVPDTVEELRSVDMEFHYDDAFGKSALPEAYERLILDAMMGDASLFTRADEVETAWGIIDPIIKTWDSPTEPLPMYKPGTWGPEESNQLFVEEGCTWSMWDGRVE
ncbi:MAG: glucose-6-phosphate dehydrogenase [Bacteroidota bacterium]